jgi:hypothetical protein
MDTTTRPLFPVGSLVAWKNPVDAKEAAEVYIVREDNGGNALLVTLADEMVLAMASPPVNTFRADEFVARA